MRLESAALVAAVPPMSEFASPRVNSGEELGPPASEMVVCSSKNEQMLREPKNTTSRRSDVETLCSSILAVRLKVSEKRGH